MKDSNSIRLRDQLIRDGIDVEAVDMQGVSVVDAAKGNAIHEASMKTLIGDLH
ncbi:unnamed protein product, partial [Symbiodinium sp. KB8]